MTAIQLTGVEKIYKGRVHALRGVDLTVHPGEVFGLLGPNGAGKSTLVKILMTVIRPTKCRGSVLGKPVGDRPTLARIGYLPEHHRFPPYLKGRQVLEFFAAMSGVARKDRQRRSAELLELVGMSDWSEKKIGGYSKGMRQRIGIAQSLMNNPDLVLLDEPTDGVDPVGRREIRQILAHLKEEGRAVFLNSHLLSEIEMVCDRVAIMVQGKVLRQGTIGELTQGVGGYSISTTTELTAEHHEVIRTAAGERETVYESTRVVIQTNDPGHIQTAIDALRAKGVVLSSVAPVRVSLEDLFMQTVEADESHGRPGAAQNRKGDRR
ncbi:MAG: ABC transporter ATP-binding protein [Phycisphaerales bacterium]|nr:ABC transporter ATP-binding protein [Planctomycetota bacterium]MCH8508234.1 ABC transporter ATP-binding protein [Phycisphaerales bacterium]